MNIISVIGILIIIILFVGIGVISGRKVKDSKAFVSGGAKSGSFMVGAVILGSLVGSQATIGTAQLAFNYGLSAWWFTLGAGIGCVILACVYAKPLRRSGALTETKLIADEYGPSAGRLSSILSSSGTFLSVLAQVVACSSLISVIFPSISVVQAVVVTAVIMCLYVVFGGSLSTGSGGMFKLLVLSSVSVLSLIVVIAISSADGGLIQSLKNSLVGTALGTHQSDIGLSNILTEEDVSNRFLSLVARGPMKDIGSAISLLLGVLSTQTYAQAIWSGSSDKTARNGGLICAVLSPIIGFAGITVGLYMRANYVTRAEFNMLSDLGISVDAPVLENSIQAFPVFALNHLPSILGGIAIGAMLITSIAAGAGLSLGMATVIQRDIIKQMSSKLDDAKRDLLVTRVVIVVIFVIAAVINLYIPNGTINDLGFLSMGLRGSTIFIPLIGALWMKGRINKKCMTTGIVIAPLVVIAAKVLSSPIDPLFCGIAAGAVCMAAGILIKNNK